jgi:hypothetical protein
MEDARKYLKDVVDPTIEEFAKEPASARRALLACIALYHVSDYLAHPDEPQITQKAFGKAAPDFLLVDRIANAAKHVVSGHVASPTHPVLDVRRVVDRPPGWIGTFAIGVSQIGDFVGGVTLADDPTVDVLAVVLRARAFVETQISK